VSECFLIPAHPCHPG